jgi:hypothetical protein
MGGRECTGFRPEKLLICAGARGQPPRRLFVEGLLAVVAQASAVAGVKVERPCDERP